VLASDWTENDPGVQLASDWTENDPGVQLADEVRTFPLRPAPWLVCAYASAYGGRAVVRLDWSDVLQ